MQIGADELSAAILDLYAAVANPDGNPDQLANVVTRCFRGESGMLQFMNAAPAALIGGTPAILSCPSATNNIDAAARDAYVSHYHDCNLWFKEGSKRGWPAIVLCHELVEEGAFLRSEWYEFCRGFVDWFHCIGTQFRVEGNFVAAFGTTKSKRSAVFDENDRRTMAVLLPHIQRACQMLHRLGAAAEHRRLTLDLLERLQMGSIVVYADGLIRWASPIAERLLSRGTDLVTYHGRLKAADPRYSRELERRIADAAKVSGSAGGLIHLSRLDGGPLSLLVAPLRSLEVFPAGASPALILFSDPEARPQFAPDAIAQTYALTAAERDLLLTILAGNTLGQYAVTHDVSYNTARTLMMRILRKSGFHRQADLIRTVMSNPLLRRAA